MHRDRDLFELAGRSGDREARELLVQRYLPLARRLAQRYRHTGEPTDDLVQVACIGLVKAIDRYDPARGSAFSTYAVPTILGELRRHFRDHTWAIHVPRDLQELALRVDRATQDLGRDGRRPTISQIAREVGASEEAVLEAREAGSAYRATSLQRRVGGSEDGDRAALGDLLPAPGDELDRAEDRAVLDRLLRRVCERDREALRMRFEEDLTQSEIGARLGISQMQVSRILRRALERLRASEKA
ncbi:MAG TPA: SigB/SigF/SigG family RNA polymerase sigma factor [Solirubrobacteraceae bacterium]|nr:SigB/SigF/SigG family RNA polymerase sigma factor [Solirubrobacteraceae bacterium]